MDKKIFPFFLCLIFNQPLAASEFPEINPSVFKNFESPMTVRILEDAHNVSKKNPKINLTQIVRTVRLCEAYHHCLDKLAAIYMPKEGETLSLYLNRNAPSKVKKSTAQVIAQEIQENNLNLKASIKCQGRDKKTKNQENFSALEYQVLKHIYQVWDQGKDEPCAKGVIQLYLDLPYAHLVASYELAQNKNLLEHYFIHAFSTGCIARRTNALEKWCQQYQK